MTKQPSSPLPGYVWDPNIARYRVLTPGYGQKPGTLVARSRVLDLLGEKIKEGEQRLQGITDQFRQGNLTAKEWQVAFAQQLKTVYLQQGSLGAGGWDRLTQSDFGRMGGLLRGEYGRLEKFAQDILDEKITPAQAEARAKMYSGKARGVYWGADQQANINAGKTEERRILGATDAHCEKCLSYAALGWTLIGSSQPRPATHPECWGNCRCDLEYR